MKKLQSVCIQPFTEPTHQESPLLIKKKQCFKCQLLNAMLDACCLIAVMVLGQQNSKVDVLCATVD
jgi:hypothetical protein